MKLKRQVVFPFLRKGKREREREVKKGNGGRGRGIGRGRERDRKRGKTRTQGSRLSVQTRILSFLLSIPLI